MKFQKRSSSEGNLKIRVIDNKDLGKPSPEPKNDKAYFYAGIVTLVLVFVAGFCLGVFTCS